MRTCRPLKVSPRSPSLQYNVVLEDALRELLSQVRSVCWELLGWGPGPDFVDIKLVEIPRREQRGGVCAPGAYDVIMEVGLWVGPPRLRLLISCQLCHVVPNTIGADGQAARRTWTSVKTSLKAIHHSTHLEQAKCAELLSRVANSFNADAQRCACYRSRGGGIHAS
jgi:hypothetical protein